MFALFLLGSAFAGDAFVQLQADTAVALADRVVDERVKVLIEKPLNEKVSLSVFTLVSPAYGELIVGPTLHVQKLALNVSIGIETADMPLRGEVYILWANDRYTFLASAETGGSGPWYVGYAIRTIGHLTVGVLTQRFDGIGPRIGVTSHGFELWTSPMYDYEDGTTNIVSGISWIP